MLTISDINNIETDEYVDDYQYYASIQRAINSGAWTFQGSYGRTMMDAIRSGRCMLGTKGFRDYYGNYIPTRDEVQSGTKGSFDFVAEQYGYEWAEALENV